MVVLFSFQGKIILCVALRGHFTLCFLAPGPTAFRLPATCSVFHKKGRGESARELCSVEQEQQDAWSSKDALRRLVSRPLCQDPCSPRRCCAHTGCHPTRIERHREGDGLPNGSPEKVTVCQTDRETANSLGAAHTRTANLQASLVGMRVSRTVVSLEKQATALNKQKNPSCRPLILQRTAAAGRWPVNQD